MLCVKWEDVVKKCYKLAYKILRSGFNPDAIAAVLRGGTLPALIISDYLGIENFYTIRTRHWGIGEKIYDEPQILSIQGNFNDKRILIVDDVVDTGKTLRKIVDTLYEKYNPIEIRSAVIYVKPNTIYVPDYYAEKLPSWKWVFFPWSVVETLFSLSLKETNKRNNIKSKALEKAKELGIDIFDKEIFLAGINMYVKRYRDLRS